MEDLKHTDNREYLSEEYGRIHSIQSLGAVDGPGLRSVVFFQGCPLRCIYCHNPDTWDFSEGMEKSVDEVVRALSRFRPYWGKRHSSMKGSDVTGGVTVSGGEPLSQPGFVLRLFQKLHQMNVHTALDTSGHGNPAWAEKVLAETDLALVDLKFLTEEEYGRGCKGSLKQTEKFLELTEKMEIPVWVRHVAVPGLTATKEYLKQIKQKAMSYRNVEKIEFLPFHNMCMEKYEQMGIVFPLEHTPVMEREVWEELLDEVM